MESVGRWRSSSDVVVVVVVVGKGRRWKLRGRTKFLNTASRPQQYLSPTTTALARSHGMLRKLTDGEVIWSVVLVRKLGLASIQLESLLISNNWIWKLVEVCFILHLWKIRDLSE